MTQYKAISLRMMLFFLLIIGCFYFAGKQMYQIQVVRHDELYAKAKEKYTARKTVARTRGEIFDYGGNLLVGNHNVMTIAYDPTVETNDERKKQTAFYLTPYTGKSFFEILARLRTNERTVVDPQTGQTKKEPLRYIILAKDVDYNLGKSIKDTVDARHYKGVLFEERTRRSYPKNELLANTLGYNNVEQDESIPVTGLEKTFGLEMHAEKSTITYERTRDGRTISYGDTEIDSAGRNGNSIYLTIREPLQSIMEEELDKMYREFQPKAIYAVMADPKTGDILAIAQRPTFNPNDRATMTGGDSYRIRVASDMYEPGSVIKPFVVSMALDRGFITPDTVIDTGFGPWRFCGRTLSDTHYIGAVKPLQIIQNSSNIGTAMIAVKMGADQLYDSLKKFQFGERTGLPLKPEEKGWLRPVNKWSGLSVSRICIGHEMTVTPLQLVRAYCMLANGGYPIRLRLVDRILSDDGQLKQPYFIDKKSVFRNPNTHKELVRMLKTVVQPGGTADQAAVPGFYVAGKTGTANKTENGHYTKKYFATFCGFVPADNPRFVLLVTCDEPQGDKQYGGSVSGPVFSAIAARALKFLGVAPEKSLDEWEAERKALVQKKWADKRKIEEERIRRLDQRRRVRDGR